MPSAMARTAAAAGLAILASSSFRFTQQPGDAVAARGGTTSNPDVHTATPSLEDLRFLHGAWERSDEHTLMREVWDPPRGDAIVGHYLIVNRGNAVLYELFAVEQDEGAPVLRLRHFNRGLVPWASEEAGPLTLTLTEAGDRRAVFENPEIEFPRQIIYEVEGDTLTATLRPAPASKREESVLKLTRAPFTHDAGTAEN